MAIKNKSNLQKILTLFYMVIFTVLSYYIFVGSLYKNNSIPNWTHNTITTLTTKHWYEKCPSSFISEGCRGKYEKIEIGKKTISAKHWTVENSQLIGAYNSTRKSGEFKIVYNHNRLVASENAMNLNEKIIWVMFLITLPVIWFSRGFAIPIVNSTMKVFNKGWKKL
jgi:hypothetical protein